MKGLLIKDFNLMKTQKKFFIIVLAVTIIMTLSQNNNSFILGYITFIIPLFSLNTISYDELDNGNAFLFTLPISRKEYVYEKYSLSLLLGAAATVSAVLISVIFGVIKKISILETLVASPFILGIMVLMISIMLPVYLKFGVDNSRFALIAVFGIISLVIFGIIKILKHCDIDIISIFNKIMTLNIGIPIAITIIIAAAFLLLSIRLSIAVINKKEY